MKHKKKTKKKGNKTRDAERGDGGRAIIFLFSVAVAFRSSAQKTPSINQFREGLANKDLLTVIAASPLLKTGRQKRRQYATKERRRRPRKKESPRVPTKVSREQKKIKNGPIQ
ncbi:hypothetical protein GWI33_001975 [Rhynchophorus ferrugineus]|uniref:Uncharacterized protein n=1 Tax=Rhynchophorus ferrugineus TaxID=354439 RepID=A0A834MLK9_RHYFE|nr:hypothetical protein GWI33_001975 [Rhynchophorus ferrugineus]